MNTISGANILATEFLDNNLLDWLHAGAIFVCVFSTLILIKIFLRRHAQKLLLISPVLGGLLQALVPRIHRFVFAVIALELAMRRLNIHPKVEQTIDVIATAALVLQVIVALTRTIEYYTTEHFVISGDRTTDLASASAQRNLSVVLKVTTWFAGMLFLLSNLGINVGTVITGLGIGGVAIALASQAILGDTFSSFVIALDKPFEVGDTISVGQDIGVVEHVSFKTTRVRSVSGELLIFPNATLTSSKVQNFRRAVERRHRFKIGIVYETSLQLMKQVPELIQAAVESVEKTRFERAFFQTFGDSALIYDISFFVTSNDYSEFAAVVQAVNFAIRENFDQAKVTFAYPTQHVYQTNLDAKPEQT